MKSAFLGKSHQNPIKSQFLISKSHKKFIKSPFSIGKSREMHRFFPGDPSSPRHGSRPTPPWPRRSTAGLWAVGRMWPWPRTVTRFQHGKMVSSGFFIDFQRDYETINEQQWIFPMMDLSKRYTCSLEKTVGKGLNDFYFWFNHLISQNRNAIDNWWFWDTLILWLNTHLTSPYSHMAKTWYPKT